MASRTELHAFSCCCSKCLIGEVKTELLWSVLTETYKKKMLENLCAKHTMIPRGLYSQICSSLFFLSIPSAHLNRTCVHLHFQCIMKKATHTSSPPPSRTHTPWRNLVICTVHVLIAYPTHQFLCTNQDARALLHKVKSGQLSLEGIWVSIDWDVVLFAGPPTLPEPIIAPILFDAAWKKKIYVLLLY